MGKGEERSLYSERKLAEALAALHRSVAACQFYPQGHPSLGETLRDGYRLWQAVEDDHRWEQPGLQLRANALWLGEERIGERSPAVATLARTLAEHGVAALRRRGGLSFEGFSDLTRLLASARDVLAAQGGIAGAWKRSGHGPALDLEGLAVVAGERKPGAAAPPRRAWGSALSAANEVRALADPVLLRRLQTFDRGNPRERRVLELLLRLSATADITAFLGLLREINGHVQRYLEAERYREAFQVVLFLHREAQNLDALGQEGKRDYLLDTVRLAVRGEFLQWLIGNVAAAGDDEQAAVGEYLLRALEKPALVPLINALIGEKSRGGRRRLLAVLIAIGEPVLPYALKMLDDQRWYVVRNMVTILGGLGSPAALKGLLRAAADPDPRIRKEAAKALGRVPAPEAEDPLLGMLEDADASVRLVAVTAAASRRTERTLHALWRAYRLIPIRAREWNLKAVALQAVGRTGVDAGVDLLAGVIRQRHWLWRERWAVVKRAAVRGLGEIGGRQVRALLEQLREHPHPEIRTAALRALAGRSSSDGAEDPR